MVIYTSPAHRGSDNNLLRGEFYRKCFNRFVVGSASKCAFRSCSTRSSVGTLGGKTEPTVKDSLSRVLILFKISEKQRRLSSLTRWWWRPCAGLCGGDGRSLAAHLCAWHGGCNRWHGLRCWSLMDSLRDAFSLPHADEHRDSTRTKRLYGALRAERLGVGRSEPHAHYFLLVWFSIPLPINL